MNFRRVVQRRPSNRGASHQDGIQHGVRRRATSPADADANIAQRRYDLFGRILVGNSPPGSARGLPQILLLSEVINFDN